MDSNRSPDDPVLAALEGHWRDLQERRSRHEAVRASAPYQAETVRLGRVTHAFLQTLRLCAFAASRDARLAEDSFFLRNVDELGGAATMAASAFGQGGLNAGRRELRYLLEQAVQSAFVDQSMPGAGFDSRLAFYERKTKHTSLDHVKDLGLEMLGDARQAFAAEAVALWAHASRYVHPTPAQLREKLALHEQGVTAGFETADQLASCVDFLFRVGSVALVLAFHAVGPSFTGDVLVGGLDAVDEWPFHAAGYVAAVDAHFDYKHERQAALEEVRLRRARRLRPALAGHTGNPRLEAP